jgi:hypothetical protein
MGRPGWGARLFFDPKNLLALDLGFRRLRPPLAYGTFDLISPVGFDLLRQEQEVK